jgi:sugar lactone lactonase YvrE
MNHDSREKMFMNPIRFKLSLGTTSICRSGLLMSILLLIWNRSEAQVHKIDEQFPVKAEIFVDEPFAACEGIAFNGEGDLFVTANRALWKVSTDGSAEKVADLFTNLGIAAIGDRDILVADFGPTNAFRNQKNNDGIIWRITPEGEKTEVVKGIGDPNFILVREDGSFLVSDDATNEIFLADLDGNLELFCTAVNHPNGLAFSLDGSSLYVAQIFLNIRPVVPDNRVWEIELEDGKPKRAARLLTRTGPRAANDGLVVDKLGRIYIAANGEGKIWRYDPSNDGIVLIAENVYGAGSLAFGEGEFDRQSLYLTTTYAAGRGGKVYRIPVGVEGAPALR